MSLDQIVTACRVCGWAALPGETLCVGCLDIREWSRVNRAFCDFFHRTLRSYRDSVDVADLAETAAAR